MRIDDQQFRDRFQSNLELLFSRAQDAGLFRAFCVALVGHFAILFALFFIFVVAPRTLMGGVPFDWKRVLVRSTVAGPIAVVTVGATLVGQLSVVGMFRPLHELMGDDEAIGDWGQALRSSLARPVATAVTGTVGLGGFLLVLPVVLSLTFGSVSGGIVYTYGSETLLEWIRQAAGTTKGTAIFVVALLVLYALVVLTAVAVLHVVLPALYVVTTRDDCGPLEAYRRGWELAGQNHRAVFRGIGLGYLALGIVNTLGLGAIALFGMLLHCVAFVVVPLLLLVEPFGFYATWLILTALFYTIEES